MVRSRINPIVDPRRKKAVMTAAMLLFFLFFQLFLLPAAAHAQGPPLAAKDSAPLSPEKALIAPTKDNPEATAAEAKGTIEIAQTVSDDSVRRKLEHLLPRYPGVRSIEIEVEDGVVTLTGHVADSEARDRVREFVRRVQGVNLVLNQTKTDIQLLTAQEYAVKQLGAYWDTISRKWLLCLFALVLVLLSLSVAKLFGRYSDLLLAPFTGNLLLRSVLGSLFAILIGVAGFLAALQLLGMTEAVLSFMGLAGVVALAIGFAFRDIAENFIASVMLGIRRPFRVGDQIEVAGHAGVVKSLNTRATILVTLDGSQVRIPNALIFKEVVINRSASTAVRGSFDLLVPWEASVATAADAVTKALRSHEGFEESPAPRTLVEAIEPEGVRLRSYFWFPSRGVDRGKLMSDAQLAAKAALQKVGIRPAARSIVVHGADQAPVEKRRILELDASPTEASKPTEEQLQENIRIDADAASVAAAQSLGDQENEVGHALKIAAAGIDGEGRNLLGDKQPS